jgi:Leucine-rich repeat (LRR) protein
MKLSNYLNLYNKNLTELPPLQPDLKTLYCHDNLLTKLPPLPLSLKRFACDKNPFTQLPSLPQSLEKIWISPWQIESCLNQLHDLKIRITIEN